MTTAESVMASVKYALLFGILFFASMMLSAGVKMKAHFPLHMPGDEYFYLSIDGVTLKLLNATQEQYLVETLTRRHERFSCSFSKWNIPSWYHVRLTHFIPRREVNVFVNRKMCNKSIISLSRDSWTIRDLISLRILLIGSTKDDRDNRSWYGDIAYLHIWDVVLSGDQIKEAGRCGGKRKIGNIFAWMKTPMINSSSVIFKETQLCEP